MMFVAADLRDFVIEFGGFDPSWISLPVPLKLPEVASSLPGEAVGTGGLHEPLQSGAAPGVRARGSWPRDAFSTLMNSQRPVATKKKKLAVFTR